MEGPAQQTISALAQRLRTVAPVLLDGSIDAGPDGREPELEASYLLERLVAAVADDVTPSRVWLLLTAVTGVLPASDEIAEGVRFFELAPSFELQLWFLDSAFNNRSFHGARAHIQLVTDRIVIDVNHSARYDLHTGVQQVVRRTVPIWARDHHVLAVAWTDTEMALRTLRRRESRRVFHEAAAQLDPSYGPGYPEVVIPWRTVVVLPELTRGLSSRLDALAQYSGNSVVILGHDCIPVVSAHLVPDVESNRFARFLTIVKHAKRVAAVSESSASEFSGYAAALAAQGLRGPDVVPCRLPTQFLLDDAGAATADAPADAESQPLVLSVGSFEPRKNHLAILYAAERLWSEGLDFKLLLIAGSAWDEEVPNRVEQLQDKGRNLVVRTKIPDSDLLGYYRNARFLVFPSIHEGYGLPVAEALSLGTPAITSSYGSTAEIGRDGGVLLVDPRDDEALVEAMRALLVDDTRLAALRAEIAARSRRTWEHYAADLWSCLVEPELQGLRAEACSAS